MLVKTLDFEIVNDSQMCQYLCISTGFYIPWSIYHIADSNDLLKSQSFFLKLND